MTNKQQTTNNRQQKQTTTTNKRPKPIQQPLQHPELYDSIAARTRAAGAGAARPRAVLFEGPPGTGKTTSARVLSARAAVPLVYVPIEALMSKWYGQSEGNLAGLFRHAKALGGCLVFLDELDSLAASRDREMHEVRS